MLVTKRLLSKLKAGDEHAFKQVYDEYEKLIYFIALQITKNKETAEEVVQDTFLNMFNSLDSYNENGKFKEWLTTIARNLSYNRVSRDKEKDTIKDHDIVDSASYNDKNVEILLTINGLLDEQSASIVIYRIFYDLTFKEIAEYLNLTIGSVQANFYKSLKVLKKEFVYEENK